MTEKWVETETFLLGLYKKYLIKNLNYAKIFMYGRCCVQGMRL